MKINTQMQATHTPKQKTYTFFIFQDDDDMEIEDDVFLATDLQTEDDVGTFLDSSKEDRKLKRKSVNDEEDDIVGQPKKQRLIDEGSHILPPTPDFVDIKTDEEVLRFAFPQLCDVLSNNDDLLAHLLGEVFTSKNIQ